jgi:flagellar biosynthesis protein FlhG
MKDQADKLREIVNNLNMKQQSLQVSSGDKPREKTARVITVTSGKGGVGKTNIAVNTAIALCELGLKVIIIDADLGLANVDILLGLVPKFTNNSKSFSSLI